MWSRRGKGKERGGEDNDKDNYNKHSREARQKTLFLLLPLHMTIMAVNYIF